MKTETDSIVIYEDSDIIVCHKPAGVPTQTARIRTPDMVSLLKTHLAASNRNGTSQPENTSSYLAVIHRLDQPVQGLLVFAKTAAAARNLNRQLTGAGFGKYYKALVYGIPEYPDGTLENYMVKDSRSNMSRICSKDTPGARLARLHYHTEKAYPERAPSVSLVTIRLDTGRHHQIRVQMAHMGCPLVGDRKYGASFPPVSGISSLQLCAYRLIFKHPATGREMTFELPETSLFC